MAGYPDSRSRRRPQHFSHLLPLGLTSTAQNYGAVLGFLAALGRGQANNNLESEHGAAVVARGRINGSASGACIADGCLGVA